MRKKSKKEPSREKKTKRDEQRREMGRILVRTGGNRNRKKEGEKACLEPKCSLTMLKGRKGAGPWTYEWGAPLEKKHLRQKEVNLRGQGTFHSI